MDSSAGTDNGKLNKIGANSSDSNIFSGHTTKKYSTLNLVLLGKKGVGKSSSGNKILGQQAFTPKKNYKSGTQDVVIKSGTVNGQLVTVYDTPGFCDPEIKEDEIQQILNEKVFQKCESGLCVFLLVIKANRFTADEEKSVEKIEKLLEKKHLNKTWILITREDELKNENKTIKDFLGENEILEKIIQKYDQRYHVFDNKKTEPCDQVKILLAKVLQRFGLKASEGGRLLRRIPEIKASTDSVLSRRIVLLGKTGFGKSATGNTILGKDEFKSKLGAESVTRKCILKEGIILDRKVSVIDTPGMFDTQMKAEDLMKEIAKSIYVSSPGPHAFLLVFPLNFRFTDQEQQITEQIELLFGEEVSKYAIILFTHGDQLEDTTIDEIIRESSRLRHLVQQCGNRYHVFNNKEKNNKKQVSDLLQMIDRMIENNGGGYYSNEMYEDALRFKQEQQKIKQSEEDERKLREKQRQNQEELDRMKKILAELEAKKSQLEEIKAKIEEERKQKEKHSQEVTEMLEVQSDPGFERFYRQYERRFSFSAFIIDNMNTISLGFLGSACGGIIGLLGGPVRVAVGASFGAAVGVAVAAALDTN